MKKYLSKTSLLLAAASFLLVPSLARANDVSDFYSKARLQILVGSSPGGGYDTYARTLARFYPKYIPGHPNIIVKNQPGAGSIVLANFVYNVAPEDGTIIAALQRNAPMVQILGQPGPKFDPKKFNWLGSLNNEVGVIALNTDAKVKKFADVFHTPAIMGASGPNDTEIIPALLDNTLGTKFKLVLGYPSATAVQLAMERGEVDGVSQSWASFKLGSSKRLAEGKVHPILQLSLKKSPELTKMGVPIVFDFIDKEHLRPGFTPERVDTLLRLLLTSKAMGRPFALGPDVPKDRLKALRAAFMETAKDRDFIEMANKQGREVGPVSGEEIQEMITKIASAPKDVRSQLNDLIQYKGKAKRVKVKVVESTGKVLKTLKGGRRVVIDNSGKNLKFKISGHRTKVMVKGKKAKRKAIKVGMTCAVKIPEGAKEAKMVSCK